MTSKLISISLPALNLDPMRLGDPREVLSFFEENHQQITTSYMFTFVQ